MSKLFRPHCGGLESSMEKLVEWDTIEDLVFHIKNSFFELKSKYEFNNIKIEHYVYDGRINWDTDIVTLKDLGVLGYTNAPA